MGEIPKTVISFWFSYNLIIISSGSFSSETFFRIYTLVASNTRNFVDVIDLLVDRYNNSIHSAIKMTPKEASRKENGNKVWRNLYQEFGGKTFTPISSIVDNVKITKKTKTFDKGYTQR